MVSPQWKDAEGNTDWDAYAQEAQDLACSFCDEYPPVRRGLCSDCQSEWQPE